MFSSLFELMGMMFLLILSGFLLRKKNIITAAGKKCLTDIILYAILPCNIIKAFSQDMGDNFWMKFMQVLFKSPDRKLRLPENCRRRKAGISIRNGLFQFGIYGKSACRRRLW